MFKGWYIMNRTTEGDWNGEFTYVGTRGNTVIDYLIVNENVCNKVLDFKVEGREDSDRHLPMCLIIDKSLREKETVEEKGNTKDKKRRVKKKVIIVWDEEEEFQREEKRQKL